MNTNMYKNIASLMVGGSILLGAVGCTDKFEDFNTDPKAPTPEEMEGDFASTATLISSIIPVVALGQENDYQMIDQMIGCEYGRMTSAANMWGSDMYYATYNPSVVWSGNTFDTNMPKIYTPFFMIRNISGTEGLAYHWANLIRVFGSLRVSDCYGPIPFSKIGTGSDFAVAYDDMPTLYNAMFEQLDLAIAGLKEAAGGGAVSSLLQEVDYIYQGDMNKWVKFANTLKLRMAMRLVNVEPQLAQRKAEEAVNDPAGVISDPSEAAWSTFIPGGNSFHKVNVLWNEGRVSADLTSYMNGYSDPRLPLYADPAPGSSSGEIVGARSGVFHYNILKSETTNYSYPKVTAQSKLLSISASESWFSRAEGALRGWNMGGTAKELYEEGVRVSMKERGAEIGNYLESTAVPAAYVALDNSSYSAAAVSTICPKYDESASFDTNLERIIVQKWLGNFPNGWESWADFRRTGFPKWFPVVNNLSPVGVTSARGMRRLPFPQSEFNTNEANVKAAQLMLDGPDNSATDLWWAKKN